jgi:hypothetical protein
MYCLQRFVSSSREFVVHELVQGQSASLDVLVDPVHARMPISHDFQGIQFEWPHQRIDRQWNIVFRFSEIANIGNLLASEFDLLKNWVFSEDVTEGSWDIKFGEAWQEDFEWSRGGCGRSVRHCRRLNLTVEFPANSIRCFGELL